MKISLVVPVLNEQDAIPVFHAAVRRQLHDYDVEIVFVNDGSSDETAAIIEGLAQDDNKIVSLEFTRNFGKEPALLAGLTHATGDAIIPIDVDLQDPVEIIPQMIVKWQEGADIVLAKRVNRDGDSWAKRKTAEWFYRLQNWIFSPRLEENVGDFRLLSRGVVDEIIALPECNLFMKGLLSWVGGRTEIVTYKRQNRVAGQGKFNGWRLWNLALEGITGFSTLPLRIWTYIGFFVALLSFVGGAWMIVEKIIWGISVPGYASLLVSILFLGGVQLVGIGILGEYVGRIYIETKRRPRYVIKTMSPDQHW